MYRYIFSLLGILALSACSNDRHMAAPLNPHQASAPVTKKLYRHFNDWRGVRYREGGMSKSGVDCSGFVHLAYKNRLNKHIPRSTERLSTSGRAVSSKNLRPGDLVFFKTGWKKRHVGIYMGRGQFMHASSSRGVMMSKLNNPYWTEAYWMARRY